jgi:hypothetical protein
MATIATVLGCIRISSSMEKRRALLHRLHGLGIRLAQAPREA